MKPFFTEADCEVPILEYGAKMSPWISLDKANRLLEERGKEIIYDIGKDVFQFASSGYIGKRTLRGVIIWTEEQDSAEKVLAEMLEWVDPVRITATQITNRINLRDELLERAKAILWKGDK